LLSCANKGFRYLKLTGITKFKYEFKRINEMDSGGGGGGGGSSSSSSSSGKMTPSCKWRIG